MNEREELFRHEIASLQLRVDQLTSTREAADLVMSSLATEVDAARSAADPVLTARLVRRLDLLRHRRLSVSNQIGVLEQLIAARRHQGG